MSIKQIIGHFADDFMGQMTQPSVMELKENG